MTEDILNKRKDALKRAVHDCFREMYAKAQPSADWDKIIKEFEKGIRPADEKVYEQHYLSQEEFEYIMDKYIKAYKIVDDWRSDVELVEDYLKNGGIKDSRDKDERYDHNPPIKDQVYNYLSKSICSSDLAMEIACKVSEMVLNTVSDCKNFYKTNSELSSFKFSVALGPSPTTNQEIVKKYWKKKTGEDIEIKWHNPILFSYRDDGYTDEDLAEEFGENWEEVTKNMYLEKKSSKKSN